MVISDERGELVPKAREVLELVAAADVVVTPGHAMVPEVLALLQGARDAGVRRVVVNHPGFMVEADEAQVKEFVRLGAYIEHSVAYYHPKHAFYSWPVETLVRWIEIVGSERTILATDLGQKKNPVPVEGLWYMLGRLLESGVREADLDLMVKKNPAWILGLED